MAYKVGDKVMLVPYDKVMEIGADEDIDMMHRNIPKMYWDDVIGIPLTIDSVHYEYARELKRDVIVYGTRYVHNWPGLFIEDRHIDGYAGYDGELDFQFDSEY